MVMFSLPVNTSLSERLSSFILSKKSNTSWGIYSLRRFLGYCCRQLGIGHAHSLDLTQTRQLANVDFVLEVVLPQVYDPLGSIYIMHTIEYSRIQFLSCEGPLQGEVDFRFADIHAEVTLNGLQREAHLHIILDIDIVEPEADTTQQRAFPALITGDDPVVDLLDLFWGETGADCFYNVLIVSLAVETTVDGVIVNTRPECCIVVVDDREVLGFVVFEDYDPAMSEDFTVIGY